MTIQEAIEKAIEGEWRPKNLNREGRVPSWIKQAVVSRSKFVERYLLYPSFWKALGKVEGWDKRRDRSVRGVPVGMVCYDYNDEFGSCNEYRPWYLENMHRMIDALADGKTLEDYFAGL